MLEGSSGCTKYVERPEGPMAWNWAGTDIGKAHHHTVVLNNAA